MLGKVTTHSHKSASHFRIPGDQYLPRRPFEAWMTLPAPRSRRAAVLGPPPRCRLSGPFETTQRLRQRHPTPNTQRPTGGPCHPTPKIRGRHPTPKSANTQRPISNTQRPKMSLCQSRRRRGGCLGATSRDASQSIRPVDLVVAALEHPTQHPTPPGRPCRAPNAQSTQRPSGHPTPQDEPPRIATPTRGVLQQDVQRRLAECPARRPRRRRR